MKISNIQTVFMMEKCPIGAIVLCPAINWENIDWKSTDWSELKEHLHKEIDDSIIKPHLEVRLVDGHKPVEALRYQQKYAEIKRSYYQWNLPFFIASVSIGSGIIFATLTKGIELVTESLIDPNKFSQISRTVWLNFIAFIIGVIMLICTAFILYKYYIKPKFNKSQDIILDLEMEIQKRNFKVSMNKQDTPR